jgi:hypothetical protein
MKSNRKDKMVFNQPRTSEERCKLARILPDRLHHRVPVAVHPIEAPAERAYAAWPELIYMIDHRLGRLHVRQARQEIKELRRQFSVAAAAVNEVATPAERRA